MVFGTFTSACAMAKDSNPCRAVNIAKGGTFSNFAIALQPLKWNTLVKSRFEQFDGKGK